MKIMQKELEAMWLKQETKCKTKKKMNMLIRGGGGIIKLCRK